MGHLHERVSLPAIPEHKGKRHMDHLMLFVIVAVFALFYWTALDHSRRWSCHVSTSVYLLKIVCAIGEVGPRIVT